MEHAIGLTSVGNARELGGYAIGSTTVKEAMLLRTATLANASEVDLHRLAETYHVGLVVDFRMAFERQQNPDPTICGARNLHVPVLEMEDTLGSTPTS